MASFPHPPRAVRTGLIDSLSAGDAIDTSDVATATQWWRAPGKPLAVLSSDNSHSFEMTPARP